MATTPPYINEAEAISIMQSVVISGEFVSRDELDDAINGIPAISNSGYIYVNSTVLPNPTTKPDGYSLVPNGTYSQTTGGNLVLTAPLNIISWDGTTWTLASEVLTPINPDDTQGTYTARQNILRPDESAFEGANAGRWGTVGTPPTFTIISGKLRITLTAAQNQWLQIPGIYQANKSYKVSLKARLVSGTGAQVTFGVATGGVSGNNFKFTPTSTEQTFTGTIVNNTGVFDLSIGTVAAQNTGQIYDFDDIVFYEDQALDTKIVDGDLLSVAKQVGRMQNPLYKLADSVYNGTSIRSSLQLYSIVTPITTNVSFKSISAKVWGTSTTKCTLRLYEATGTETMISQMKYIQEWKYAVGELNQIEGEFVPLTLDAVYDSYSGSKLVLFLYTESGDNIRTKQLLPTDAGYADGAFYYILGVVPANPWYKTGVNPLSLTGAGSAKSEAIIIINERYSTEKEVQSVTQIGLLQNRLADLTLTGWYNNAPYIEAVGDGVFANNRAVFPANTVVSELDVYGKLRPIEVGSGGLEFGVARRSYLAGTAVTIGNNGATSFLKIYRLETDTPILAGTFTLPFLVEVGATYQIRVGKRQAQLLVEVWKDTGEYYSKTDWYQTSPDNPNFGGCWGHPTFYAVTGKIQAHSFDMITTLPTNGKLVAWGDSYIEASTLGVDRSGSYINLFRSRIGEDNVAALGRGGETDITVSNRFDWELDWFRNCKYAYLALGVNNTDYDLWLAAYKDLISKVRTKGLIPILATVTANTNGSNLSILSQQNDWIRNVSGEIYVDVHKAVSAGGSAWKPGTVMPDGIHPTLLGHQFIFNRQCYDLSFLL